MNVFSTAVEMKCFKVDEYINRTVSVKETKLLLQELEVSAFRQPPDNTSKELHKSQFTFVRHDLRIHNTGMPRFEKRI